jgi:hypothetical protein
MSRCWLLGDIRCQTASEIVATLSPACVSTSYESRRSRAFRVPVNPCKLQICGSNAFEMTTIVNTYRQSANHGRLIISLSAISPQYERSGVDGVSARLSDRCRPSFPGLSGIIFDRREAWSALASWRREQPHSLNLPCHLVEYQPGEYVIV